MYSGISTTATNTMDTTMKTNLHFLLRTMLVRAAPWLVVAILATLYTMVAA